MEVANGLKLILCQPGFHEDASCHEEESARITRHPPLESATGSGIELLPVKVNGDQHVVGVECLGSRGEFVKNLSGILGESRQGRSEQNIDRKTSVSGEDIAEKAVFAAGAPGQHQHVHGGGDDFNIDGFEIVLWLAVIAWRKNTNGQ